MGKEFCNTLLREYDYCFAVHNDHDHMHVHVVFNSVNRISGYKYRYVDGDWEKLIQPVTDRLCEKYGLSWLEYDKEKERIGKSYSEHMADKNSKPTGISIIRQDIDYAISQADDITDFYRIMEEMGYKLRKGYSKRLDREYVAYHAPGMSRARRDYKLGEGYTISDIRKRLIDKAYDKDVRRIVDATRTEESTARVFPDYDLDAIRFDRDRILQIAMLFRIGQAYGYLGLKLYPQEQHRVRRDLLQIDRYREEANYLLDNDIRTPEDISNRLSEVRKKLRTAKKKLSKDDIRLQLLMKERRILMRLTKDVEETLNVRQISCNKQLRGIGKQKYIHKMPQAYKEEHVDVKMEGDSLWKN